MQSSTSVTTRTQLTLFVTGRAAEGLDALRRDLDPVQHALIAAHVTLCREDEIAGIAFEVLASRLAASAPVPLTLTFGEPERFSGHGVLLPCIAGAEAFHRLRIAVLGREDVRHQDAHITLAHPRNPRAAGNSDAVVVPLDSPLTLHFARISLIEQQGSQRWQVLTEFDLARD